MSVALVAVIGFFAVIVGLSGFISLTGSNAVAAGNTMAGILFLSLCLIEVM